MKGETPASGVESACCTERDVEEQEAHDEDFVNNVAEKPEDVSPSYGVDVASTPVAVPGLQPSQSEAGEGDKNPCWRST